MGPRKRWAGLFLISIVLVYWPLSRWGEPALREAWFRVVTRSLVKDVSALRPPDGKRWLGASRPELPQSLYGIYELERGLGRSLAVTSFYQAWGDLPEHAFPSDVIRSLRKGGYLPFITWEPWLAAFARWQGQVPTGSLGLIRDGAVDDYVRTWARAAVKDGGFILVRLAHEPTNPLYGWASTYGNSAHDYVAFWLHVRAIFREEGARNVAFVWTPFGLEDRAWFPGRDQVDWIGFDLFNYGGLSEQGTWLDFYTLAKLFRDAYHDLGAPLLIAEVATSSAGGNKGDWIRDMFQVLAGNDFPDIRAVVLFDQPNGQTATGLPINWSLAEVDGVFETLTVQPRLFANFTSAKE
jgi:hypothetical protein